MGSFGVRLKEVRIKQNVKQKELASELDIAISTLSQYENDKRHPNFESLVKISKFFNVSTDYLLGVEDEERVTCITKNIDFIDIHANDKLKLSYNELIGKITNNLVVISENYDYKSLEIMHKLYNSISLIAIEHKQNDSINDIEFVLSNHLSHKEDIDQTINKLFRHHIKKYSDKTS